MVNLRYDRRYTDKKRENWNYYQSFQLQRIINMGDRAITELMKVLNASEINLNLTYDLEFKETTLFMTAAKNNQLETCRVLVDHGADMNQQIFATLRKDFRADGCTPFMAAIFYDNLEICRYIINTKGLNYLLKINDSIGALELLKFCQGKNREAIYTLILKDVQERAIEAEVLRKPYKNFHAGYQANIWNIPRFDYFPIYAFLLFDSGIYTIEGEIRYGKHPDKYWDICFKTPAFEFTDDKFSVSTFDDEKFVLASGIRCTFHVNDRTEVEICNPVVYYTRRVSSELSNKIPECLYKCENCEYGYPANDADLNKISTIVEIQDCECGKHKIIT